jgi:hypothetical protein
LKAEVAEYRSHRHAAHQFRKELRQQSEAMEDVEDELQSVRKDVALNEAELKRVAGISSEVELYVQQEDDLRQELVRTLSLKLRAIVETFVPFSCSTVVSTLTMLTHTMFAFWVTFFRPESCL